MRFGDFAVLVGIGDHRRIGHLRVKLVKRFSICSSLWINCMLIKGMLPQQTY